jgi:hypothetical protein
MFAMTPVRVLAVMVGAAFAALLALAAFSSTADANHSWSNYHWGRTGEFSLQLDDNVTSAWDPYLKAASGPAEPYPKDPSPTFTSTSDWTDSGALNTFIVQSTNTKQCSATSGRVEVCNAKYGQNGWLGLASVWASGGHIVQGTAKMNDTYFGMTRYNTPAWRHLVMCQEVGHTFGLAHQNENNGDANLGSCMDYSSDPDGGAGGGSATDPSNEAPNQHDYEQLGLIYNHTTDTKTTVGSTSAASALPAAARAVDTANPSERGQLVYKSADGGVAIYVREFSGENQVITRVIRAVDGTPALETNRDLHHHHDHDHDH